MTSTSSPPHPLVDLLAGTAPFALLRREGSADLELLTGELATAPTLAQLPLPPGAGPATLAVVPYRQLTERGFACVDDHAPLEFLRVADYHRLPYEHVVAALPADPVATTGGTFDLPDEAYEQIVADVLRDEIGRGEGANFVIHRTFTAQLAGASAGAPVAAAAAAFRQLLTNERGAYWTFLVHTGTRTLVGATPERHVSVDAGLVMMNPISGTFRASATPGGPDRAELLRFLADPKETNELYMVLDEELKMMATVADQGGQVVGPYLKEMSQLVHTEYLLAGRTTRDVREVLRETMFAPTVTGSPMENACRVIARHEHRGRGRYSGVLALLGHDPGGQQTLDAPILIRFAELDPGGHVRVPVGATLVRDSTAAGEVAETHAKAAGVLAALGLRPSSGAPAPAGSLAADHYVRAALAARNDRLSRFWLEQRQPPMPGTATALVVDAEDTFTGMLVHQLRALGLRTTLRPWHDLGDLASFDLVVPGPGPGDPTDPADPKMAALQRLIRRLLDQRQPMLAVCLSHQLLAGLLGLALRGRSEPYQGLPRDIELFGRRRRVGYYATFTALAEADRLATQYGPVEVSRDPTDRTVHALRGRSFAGVQFHPESVLTEHGPEILTELVAPLVPGVPPPSQPAAA